MNPETGSGGEAYREIARHVAQLTAEHARLFQELAAGQRRFRHLARAVWAVQEEERRRLSLELHDGLGQNLTALKLQLEGLAGHAREAGSPLAAGLAEAVDAAARALEEARDLAHRLRPRILDDLGLVPALRWLARTHQARTGLAVEMHCTLEAALDPELETVVFRVVQEALTNAAKHAEAPSARVEVELADRGLRLVVADGGRGFDPAALGPAPGAGLGNMRDRVEVLGGSFRLHAAPGQGTRLEIELPCESLGGAP